MVAASGNARIGHEREGKDILRLDQNAWSSSLDRFSLIVMLGVISSSLIFYDHTLRFP